MAERTTVHLVRHGEVYNPDGLLYGRLPGYHLSDLGQRMAGRAAHWLAPRDVVAVWSSPLERAVETAAPTGSQFELPITTDDRLMEPTNVFEGRRVAVGDGVLREPWAWKYLRNPFRPSWGEPYADIAKRMRAVISDAHAAATGREIVLVSHQLTVWVARLSMENRRLWHDPRRRQCALASITSLIYDDDRLVAISYTEPAADLVALSNRGVGA